MATEGQNTYRCEISGWKRRVKADSPESAARKAADSYVRTHDFFAGTSTDVAVDVDGVEYIPEEVATECDRNTY